MTITKPLMLLALVSMIGIISCRDDSTFDKYARPEWLAGKVYTQIKAQKELSEFAKCIELTGYDTILDVSGSYTIFAPSNDAFALYFQQNSKWKKVEDIPPVQLSEIVKFHIVQNPWSKIQLRSLDVYGWIDSLNINNNKPRGFKRETLLMNRDLKYGLKGENRSIYIVDTLASNWYRRVATDSRKYAPLFFREYFDIYDLNFSDYEFYFQRPFEGSNDIYYAGARIMSDEIFAENGFVYLVDRVVDPMRNAYELLEDKESGHEYSDFLDLINTFPVFGYDAVKTNNQPGAREGKKVDSLFNLSYPQLTFHINKERTKAPSSSTGLPANVSIRYHHGLLAPENSAFREFLNQYINGAGRWGSLKNTPSNIKRIIANTHMCINPIYLTDLETGFLNGEDDMVMIDKSSIIQKQFGSNCTFLGLNKTIVPRAFKSVTGPVYLQPGYSTAMYAIENSGLLAALKRERQNYMLFVESDLSLADDSSLLYVPTTSQFRAFQITGSNVQLVSFTVNDLRNMLLNHIGVEIPRGIASKEFIKTLGGNYLIVNNQTGEISGTGTTMIGYNGAKPAVTRVPRQISTNTDNGKTYEINNWFSFASTDLYVYISTTYPTFHQLLVKAGLALEKEYRYNFISESEFYTIFVPSAAAITVSNANSLPKEELQKFLRMHFIAGQHIFTDGNKPSGYYETTRIDEKSTPFSTVYSQVYIGTEPDRIRFRYRNGENYLTIQESPVVNTIAIRNLGTGNEPIKNIMATAVIHEINKVLVFDQLDTK